MTEYDFGTFPDVPDDMRYGAAWLSDNEWCTWDYKTGRKVGGNGSMEHAQICAKAWNNPWNNPVRSVEQP